MLNGICNPIFPVLFFLFVAVRNQTKDSYANFFLFGNNVNLFFHYFCLFRYSHVEKDHLVKLLKQLIISTAPPSRGISGGNAPNAADVPTLMGTGSFSLLRLGEITLRVLF